MNSTRTLPSRCQRFLRLGQVLVGIGFIAGPGLSLLPAADTQAAGLMRSHAVQADSLPATPDKPAAGSDLLLRKENERMAEALAAFSQGLAAEGEGDTEAAFAAYRRSLASDPANTELAVKVAFEIARRGDVRQGIELLKDAAKAAPNDFLPPLCLSQLYSKFLKKQEVAQKYAQAALDLEPGNFAPYLALFEIYTGAGQTKKAETVLDRAAKVESSDGSFWLQLGEIFVRAALNPDGTLAPESLKKANAAFQKAGTYTENNPDLAAKLADFYVITKQPQAAIPFYVKAIQANRDLSPEERIGMSDKLAQSYLSVGQREQAIAVLEQIRAEAPTRIGTYELLGDLYNTGGHLEKAISIYQSALLLDSSKPGHYLRIADLQLRARHPEAAVEGLAEARKKFPAQAQITYAHGVALSQASRYKEAVAAFDEALLEAKASNPALLTGAFYLAYGNAVEQAGDLDRAVSLLRKSIELSPDNPAQACNALGYLWVERGINLEEAAVLIQRALSLDPANGAYLDSLGWYFWQKRDYPRAIESLLKAAQAVTPADPIVYEHLGDAYAANHDPANALAAWKKALVLDAGNQRLAGKITKAQEPPAHTATLTSPANP